MCEREGERERESGVVREMERRGEKRGREREGDITRERGRHRE